MIQLTQILVATDFSEVSTAAIDDGRDLARPFGASLQRLHVMENPFLEVRHPEREFITPDALGTIVNSQPGGRT
jgi:hypothetical protein